MIVDAACEGHFREVAFNLRDDLRVAHLGGNFSGAGIEAGERLHRKMQHHTLSRIRRFRAITLV